MKQPKKTIARIVEKIIFMLTREIADILSGKYERTQATSEGITADLHATHTQSRTTLYITIEIQGEIESCQQQTAMPIAP